MLFTEKKRHTLNWKMTKIPLCFRVGFRVHCWMENLTWVFVEVFESSSRMTLRACIQGRIRTCPPLPRVPPSPSRDPSRQNAPCAIR